jgi:putative (di)nucleoside polyphosphate hydrolase
MASAHFRAGVVIVVRHPDTHEVLAFERCDARGHWQLPQGGLRDGETPLEGAWREMLEETGLDEHDVELVSEHPEWLVYEWPLEVQRAKGGIHHRIGQVQRWFTFHPRSADLAPTPDGTEFVAWKWVTPEWLIDHVPGWRRGPYQAVLGQHR